MPTTQLEVDQVIARLEAAAVANLATPTRRGNLIVLDGAAGDDVLVTADLHGHRHNFEQILALADLEQHPRRHLVLQEVCHGGPAYPAGGCQSHRMLEDVAALKVRFPEQVHFILSNHELAELTEFPITKDGKMLALSFRLGLAHVYDDAAERVYHALMAFVGSCPLGVRLPGEVLICHSAPEYVDLDGFDPGVFERPLALEDFQEGSDLFRLVWGRDYRPDNAQAFAEICQVEAFIHGHTPAEKGYEVPNDRQVILDCCSRPAGVALLPLSAPLTHAAIVAGIRVLD